MYVVVRSGQELNLHLMYVAHILFTDSFNIFSINCKGEALWHVLIDVFNLQSLKTLLISFLVFAL